MTRLVSYGAIALAAVALLIIVTGGGATGYVVDVALADAAGLRQNSPVMIGGVQAGTVAIRLGRGDQVVAELHLDRAQAPVGRDASVAIAAVNFLGQKEAELTRGNLADPAPSGYTIPASRVAVSTDLDQVLGVLDASTRARLAILIDEAGTALTGRRDDLSTVLGQLTPSLQSGDALLTRLVADNHTLGHVVATSDAFVAQVNAQRSQLAQLVDRAGQAAVTVAARRAQLAQTLSHAPATLATLQTFLAKLQATTIPLGPAARNLAVTAPLAAGALAQVDPFVAAASPLLHRATAVAPELGALAAQATPVIQEANPAVASLSSFSTALAPISDILDRSVDNILAVVENWSRAIQFRDGLSHVFRGEASITPDVVESLVNRLLGGLSAKATARPSRPAASSPAAAAPSAAKPGAPVAVPAPHSPSVLARLGSTVNGVVGSTVNAAKSLLGKVLQGATGTGGAPGSGGAPGTGGTSGQTSSGSSLSNLLNYLLGR